MKKLLALITLVSASSVIAAGYGTAGCGLGSMVFGKKKGLVQVFAATTNGTSGSQTFGISSGTSNCESGGKKATQFIEVNKASLSNEAAVGNGESLTALSEIYGCTNVEEFNGALKTNFERIFQTENSVEIHKSIQSTIKAKGLSCAHDLV